jgi:hypothetical protein
LVEALRKCGSGAALEAMPGMIPNSEEGKELKARMKVAQDALEAAKLEIL